MGIPNTTHQAASNVIAGLGNWISLHTGSGAGTTGANEFVGSGGYARVQATTVTPDGAGDNTYAQVNVPCPASTPTSVSESGIFSTATGSFLAVPSGVAIAGSTTGGTIAAGTWFLVMTAFNHAGETTASAEVSVTTTGTTSSATVTWSHVSGVYDIPTLGQNLAGYRFYWGSGSGAENVLIGSAAANATSWTYTGSTGTSATAPGANTAATFIASAALVGGPFTANGPSASINVVPGWSV